jgi:hypothetical protein
MVIEREKPRMMGGKKTIPLAEEELIQLLLSVPELMSRVDVNPEEFLNHQQRRVFEQMKAQFDASGKISIPALADECEAESREWLMQLSLEEREVAEPIERLEQLVRDIRIKKDKKRLQDLSRLLAVGQAGSVEQQEYKDLLRRIKGSLNDTKGMVTK